MKRFITLSLLFALIASATAKDSRPNIVWIVIEDMSTHFSCYGEKTISTPHIDKLASEGSLFTKAYVTAPVCSTARSAMITGMYQTSIGAHQHRSGRGELKITLSKPVVPVPVLFRKAGYHTSNTGWPSRKGRLGKTDYNFEWPKEMYDGTDWSKRKPGQPFFAQLMLIGGKMSGANAEGFAKMATKAKEILGQATTRSKVTVPPYYPRDETILQHWASYLDAVRVTDHQIGEIVARLKKEGVYENTIIVLITDHGISHARGKQFCYEEGMHIPFIASGPGIPANKRRTDLIEHIDMAALSLAAAGIDIPKWMQARDIFAPDYQLRKYAFSARDRCDETVERIRAVRSDRYKYIRNFHPKRPHLQPCAYKDNKAILIALSRLHEAGQLDEHQDRIFTPTRPEEELYDLQKDKWELNNLADDPKHAKTLKRHRAALNKWIKRSGDQGETPESEAMYDSDMAVYLNTIKKKIPERAIEIQANIDTMKRWAKEGK